MTNKPLQIDADVPVLIQLEVDLPNIAKRVAKILVREKLATKAMVIPRVTAYEWIGNILTSRRQYRVDILTCSSLFGVVSARLQDLVPEIDVRKFMLAGQ